MLSTGHYKESGGWAGHGRKRVIAEDMPIVQEVLTGRVTLGQGHVGFAYVGRVACRNMCFTGRKFYSLPTVESHFEQFLCLKVLSEGAEVLV
jgi:hypothetical protein